MIVLISHAFSQLNECIGIPHMTFDLGCVVAHLHHWPFSISSSNVYNIMCCLRATKQYVHSVSTTKFKCFSVEETAQTKYTKVKRNSETNRMETMRIYNLSLWAFFSNVNDILLLLLFQEFIVVKQQQPHQQNQIFFKISKLK